MTTRRWAVLAPLLTASCALFGIDPDANDDDSGGSNDSADDAHTNDEGYTDEGGGDLSCPGTAFTRTDDPGTAICLDGLNSFECAWGS